jgi:hypothetical protein
VAAKKVCRFCDVNPEPIWHDFGESWKSGTWFTSGINQLQAKPGKAQPLAWRLRISLLTGG